MKNELLIVIPAYNEEKNIEAVVTFIREKYSQYDYKAAFRKKIA